jgi:hypothetical protein
MVLAVPVQVEQMQTQLCVYTVEVQLARASIYAFILSLFCGCSYKQFRHPRLPLLGQPRPGLMICSYSIIE